MVQGVTLAHKGLAPSRLISYFRKRKMPMLGTHTGLAKVAVQCSADTFVVNQSLVLRINICGENRHLRQARNRQAVKKLTFFLFNFYFHYAAR